MGTHELRNGTILSGRYVIDGLLGSGGFGITYLAHHEKLGTWYAIKELFISGRCVRSFVDYRSVGFQNMTPQSFDKFKKRFLNEANTLAKMSNGHIVHVEDVFEENDTAYIVMDYIEGQTLQKRIENGGALSYAQSVNYIAQLTEAVEYIHSNHILHRDIKPENIMITPDERVVLIDFGAARSFVHDAVQSHTTFLTPGYSPIEQYTPTSKKGNYSDIYSLGCVFYFILTGQKPLDAANRMLDDRLVPPSLLCQDLSEQASNVILKAMNLKPEDRYQTVSEFKKSIINIQESDSDESGGSSGNGKGKERSLLAIILILAIVAFVISLSIFIYFVAYFNSPVDFIEDEVVLSEYSDIDEKYYAYIPISGDGDYEIVKCPWWCDCEISEVNHQDSRCVYVKASLLSYEDEREGTIAIRSRGRIFHHYSSIRVILRHDFEKEAATVAEEVAEEVVVEEFFEEEISISARCAEKNNEVEECEAHARNRPITTSVLSPPECAKAECAEPAYEESDYIEY